jgi:eukaryotic-like serine/threonine-protein kinase
MNQPRTFGPYTLLRRLAVGGMAEIYVASTPGLGGFEKLAALKLVHPHLAADPQFVRMLIEEAKILVLLTHANIAQVFDLGCIDDTYYIAMEFVDGLDVHGLQTVSQRLQQPLPIAVCTYVVAEMLNGLDYAHRKRDANGKPLNIVHRDISPQNVVVSQAGEVKLVDFGIAKTALQSERTAAGVIKGKYFYMSPEQAWGDPADRRSDVFATGILLHEMLTGHMLYTGRSVPELIANVRKAEIPRPELLRPDVSDSLSAIVMRALEREPRARFQSAIDMGEALRDFLYSAFPAYNAGKLGEFVLRMATEAERANEKPAGAEAASPDETRKLRALTRDDYVGTQNSVLFSLSQHDLLATRQDLPSKDKRASAKNGSDAPAGPSPRTTRPAGSAAPAPVKRNADGSTLAPPRAAALSSWPLGDAPVEARARGSDGRGPGQDTRETLAGRSRSDPPTLPHEDAEPTTRYLPVHGLAMRGGLSPPLPSVLPSLSPPSLPPPLPGRVPPRAANGMPALVPPRGLEPSLGPIPPSPAVPNFQARGGVRWLPIFLGAACAMLGMLGYRLWQDTQAPEPAPHVEVMSAPGGAQLRVDGRLQPGTTPLRLVGLQRGRRYALRVELAGYQPWSVEHLAGDSNVQQIAVLKPVTRTLQVVSSPPGAQVFMGESLLGLAPVSVPSLPVGKPVQLRVELQGHASVEREVTLAEDEPGDAVARFVLAPRRR